MTHPDVLIAAREVTKKLEADLELTVCGYSDKDEYLAAKRAIFDFIDNLATALKDCEMAAAGLTPANAVAYIRARAAAIREGRS